MSLFRLKRVNEQLKRELSTLIRKLLPVEDHGLISVTEVDVSKDLKSANVYVSAIGVAKQTDNMIASLEKRRIQLQHELSKRVVIKYTPHLIFKQDTGLERGQHLVELLDSLESEKKPGNPT